MAIIYTYGFDDNVQDNDAWIGTNATNRKTKQFTVASVANYLNNAGRIAVGGQMTFKFVTSGASNGTISIPGGGGAGTNFTDIASLYVSVVDTSGANVTEWLNYLVGQELLLSEQNEPNNFGHYRITSYTIDTNPNFYTLVLTDIGGYGVITADTYYNLNNVNLISGNVDPTGLEAINEGNGVGWRLIGRDADNYGPIGLNAIDFSNSDSISTEKGSTGENSITFGNNNINQQSGSIVLGANQSVKITDTFQGANIITGFDNFIWGATYTSLIAAYRSTIGVEGTNYTTNALYQSLIVGDGHNYYAGRDSGVVGGGLISGSTGCFTVGIANEDLTTTTSNWLTAQYNNYGPRFIVGVGTYTPTTGIAGVRQNGFVVMSDGTATFPVLTNAMIDAADDDSAVTKGWVATQTSAAESNFVFYTVKNSSGAQILKGKAVMAVGTDGNSGHILIDEMIADGSIEPKYFMGVLETTLDNGEIGRVIHFGELSQFNTNGQNGEVWSDGDVLWCDPANPGDFTIVEPQGPNLKIASAIVINKATNGKIKVRVQGNEGIRDLYDTRITSQSDGDLLVWNDIDSVWQSDGTATIDYTNGRVGIGTTSPSQKLDIAGNAVLSTGGYIYGDTTNPYIRLSNTGGAVLGYGTSQLINGGSLQFQSTGGVKFRVNSSGGGYIVGNFGFGTTSPTQQLHVNGQILLDVGHRFQLWNDNVGIYRDSNDLMLNGFGNVIIKSSATTMTAQTERMRITSTGNVGIGITSPLYTLDVSGPARIDGTLRVGTTSQQGEIKIIDSNGITFSLTSGVIANNKFAIENRDTNTQYLVVDGVTSNVGIGTTSPGYKLDVNGSFNFVTSSIYLTYNSGILYHGNYYQISSGNDYKLFSRTNGALILGSNDTERMRITSGGNVGIGTTSPSEKLEVVGYAKATTGFKVGSYGLIYESGNNLNIKNSAFYHTIFHTNNAERMRITDAGNVGIGTTSPSTKLHVVGDILANNYWVPSGSNAYYMNYNSTAGMYIDSTHFITLNAGGNEGIRIESIFGNVGIGTTSPSEKLDVDGNIKLGATTGRQLMFGENKYGAIRLGNNTVIGGNQAVDIRTGNASVSSQSSRVFINQTGFVGVGTTTPIATLDVNGPIKIGGSLLAPAANTVGAMRYRADSNNSYVEMIMQTGASAYAWVVIKQNTW